MTNPIARRRGPNHSKTWFCPACGAPAARFVQRPPHKCFWVPSCAHAVYVVRISPSAARRLSVDYAAKLGRTYNEYIASCTGEKI